jgi:hypothetical protein
MTGARGIAAAGAATTGGALGINSAELAAKTAICPPPVKGELEGVLPV